MAQEMLAKKWEVLEDDKDLDDVTLQQYLDIYIKPLSQSAIHAVEKQTEMAALMMMMMMKKKKRAGQLLTFLIQLHKCIKLSM
jgi:hypothetical protein